MIMKNKSLFLLVAALIISANNVSADDSSMSSHMYMWSHSWAIHMWLNGSWTINKVTQIRENIVDFKMTKEQLKENRKALIETLKEKKQEAKDNREQYKETRDELKDSVKNVTDEQKAKLEELRNNHKAVLDNYKEQLKDTSLTSEQKEEIKTKMLESVKMFNIHVREVLQTNAVANEILEKRIALKEQNAQLRAEEKEARVEYREWRDVLVEKYKWAFQKQLNKNITKFSDDNLEKISTKIEKLVETTQSNTRLSETTKQKLLAQYISLKEIIDEELETRDMLWEDLEVELD